jgi:hypothetical protein
MNNGSRREFLRNAGKSLASFPMAISVLAAAENKPARTGEMGGSKAVSGVPGVHLNVRDFGAAGDGKSKDTAALQMALDRCSVLGGGQVLAPPGDYLTGALVLRSNTTLHLEAGAALHASSDLTDYVRTQVRWEGKWVEGYLGFLSATDAENVAIDGAGKIEGSTAFTRRVDENSKLRYPALLEFVNCRNLRVEGCETVQYGMWSIHPTYCENVVFKHISVKSGADGIDVDSCKHVVIDGCNFDTGDDCISLKSGRGAEGYMLGRTTEDVRISDCVFSDSHWACIGIGSETSGGIRNVRVEDCRCVHAKTFAIYIKSRPGRGAFIEDISVSDFEVFGAELGFLRLNFLNSGKQDETPVPGDDGIPTIRGLHFERIHVNDTPVLVKADEIDSRKPLDGFSLVGVTGTCQKGILLANTRKAVIEKIQVTGFAGPLLSTYRVTGKGLNGAAPLPEPKRSEEILVPAVPYVLR